MKPVIFCDFDGTITKNDNIVSIMKQFEKEQTETIIQDVLDKKISIQEGVGKMFSLLDSEKKDEIIQYLEANAEIREGFDDFISYVKEQNIPFYVVSGGIDFFVEPLLEGLVEKEAIFCNSASFQNNHIEILWPHSCDDLCQNGCGCCKPSVMRKLATNETFKIVIGDSITDLEAAKMADFVLARDYLVKKCEEEGIPYKSFETFYDCLSILKEELEVRT
jgi:2-hydroxy-3-keto-5-methylthiopentenyl-1-phosphate phosphatase